MKLSRRKFVAGICAFGLPFKIGVVRSESRDITPQLFGVVADGVIDCTDGLIRMFEAGGSIHIPSGRYCIRRRGPDAGGVLVRWTKSFDVKCDPGAIFLAGDDDQDSSKGLDNDLFRFVVPKGGAGLAGPEALSASWDGGTIDQRLQMNSKVVPLRTKFHSASGGGGDRQGQSNTTDGISFRASYRDGDDRAQNGAKKITVKNVTFVAGDHWQNAGGDSGLFIGSGCALSVVEDCTFTGHRDNGCYGSRDGSGATGGPIVIRRCTFKNCFFPITLKRGASDWEITDNYFENAVTAFQTNPTNLKESETIGGVGGVASGNRFHMCLSLFKLHASSGAAIDIGRVTSMGCVLADGVTPLRNYGFLALSLTGSSKNRISNGVLDGITESYRNDDRIRYRIMKVQSRVNLDASGQKKTVQSDYNSFSNITAPRDFYAAGYEEQDGGDFNTYDNVVAEDGRPREMIVKGRNSKVN